MTDKELYYILCPDGCWHEVNEKEGSYPFHCKHCGTRLSMTTSVWIQNPDFTTWDGLGVMLTEGQKRNWWKEFIEFCWNAVRPLPQIKMVENNRGIIFGNLGFGFPEEFIQPIPMRDALKEFHGGVK